LAWFSPWLSLFQKCEIELCGTHHSLGGEGGLGLVHHHGGAHDGWWRWGSENRRGRGGEHIFLPQVSEPLTAGLHLVHSDAWQWICAGTQLGSAFTSEWQLCGSLIVSSVALLSHIDHTGKVAPPFIQRSQRALQSGPLALLAIEEFHHLNYKVECVQSPSFHNFTSFQPLTTP